MRSYFKAILLIYIFLGLIHIFPSKLFSQNNEIDSLKNIVQENKKDSISVNALIELSKVYLKKDNIKKSLVYAKEALKIANQIGFKKGIAFSHKQVGMAYYYQGNFLDVFDSWEQSLKIFETIQDTLGIANMVNNIGSTYYSIGNNTKAIEYYLRSLGISEKQKNPLLISSALANIGGVYVEMENYDKALNYFKQIEKYLPELDDPQILASYFLGIGEIYDKKENYKKALNFYNQALPINKSTPNYAHNLTMLGKVEFKNGEVIKAKNHLIEAYHISKNNNLRLDELQTLIALGDIYQNNDFEKAISTYNEAEQLAIELETTSELRDIYKGFYQTYEYNNDFKNAFTYQTKYLNQKDMVFNMETDDRIRGLQFDFDLDKKQDEISLLEKEAKINQLQGKRQKSMTYASVIATFLVFFLALGTYRRYRYVKKTNRIIQKETEKSEELLLNILPEETALELKQNGKVQAKQFTSVSVMFTDFKEFTNISHDLSPEELVKSVDFYFSKFDKIMEKYGLEKIKTIGDAYMCAGGLPFPTNDHADKMIQAAFEISEFMKISKKMDTKNIKNFEIRIGINTGPVVAGVVGIKKFAYDIWGDTVNVASRMESNSKPGKINISENTYELIKDKYDCEYRGEIHVKNKGMMKMFFVNGVKNKPAKKMNKVNQINI